MRLGLGYLQHVVVHLFCETRVVPAVLLEPAKCATGAWTVR